MAGMTGWERTSPPAVIAATTGIHKILPLPLPLLRFALGLDATPRKAHAPQPRRARAWMRARAMGQDAPYGAAPRKAQDLVALDSKKLMHFLWLLSLLLWTKKVTRPLADGSFGSLLVIARTNTQKPSPPRHAHL